jgi:hypothetical protein
MAHVFFLHIPQTMCYTKIEIKNCSLKNLAGPENFTCFVERTTKSSNSQPLDYGKHSKIIHV